MQYGIDAVRLTNTFAVCTAWKQRTDVLGSQPANYNLPTDSSEDKGHVRALHVWRERSVVKSG